MSARPPLDQLLNGYLAATLGSIAAACGLRGATKGKQATMDLLLRELPRPERVTQAVAGLDPSARALLDHLRAAGGRAGFETLLLWCHLELLPVVAPKLPARAYGDEGFPIGDPKAASKELQHVLARLESAGLVFGWGNRSSYDPNKALDFGRGQTLVIPAEIDSQLPGQASLKLSVPSAPAATLMGDAQAGQRQLFLLWSWFWRAEPQLLKATARLAKREIKLLSAALPQWVAADAAEEEQPWLHWGHQLLLQLRLLREGERSQGRSDEAEAYWSAPLGARLGSCLSAAQELPSPVELLASGLEPARHAGSTWIGARRHVLAQLQVQEKAASGTWSLLTDLERALAVAGRDLLVPPSRRDYGYYAYEQPSRYRSGHFLAQSPGRGAADDVSGWPLVEMAFVRRLLIALWWLGLVDLGLSGDAPAGAPPPEAITHLRLSGWGRHLLLGETAPTEEQAEARIVLQPNFQILVMGPVAERRLLTLERFADRTGADRALIYTLSRDSVYRGQRAGIGVTDMMDSLAELTGAELPQNVAHSLRDWQQLHERVVLRRGVVLLQAAEPEEARIMAAALGAGVLEPLGEGFLMLRDVAALRRRMESTSLLLEVERADQPPPARRMMMDADGRLRLPLRCPDPRLLGRVQALAEGDSATGWRLTEGVAQRNLRERGLDAAAQVDQWRDLIGGPLPEALVRRIQRGTGQGGQARLYRGSYLELPDDATLRALAALPQLAGRIRSLALRGPLLQVDEGSLPDLEAALDELGLKINDGPAPEGPAASAGPAGAAVPPTAPKRRGRPPKAG